MRVMEKYSISSGKRRRTEKGRDGRKKEKNDEEARTEKTPKTGEHIFRPQRVTMTKKGIDSGSSF